MPETHNCKLSTAFVSQMFRTLPHTHKFFNASLADERHKRTTMKLLG